MVYYTISLLCTCFAHSVSYRVYRQQIQIGISL